VIDPTQIGAGVDASGWDERYAAQELIWSAGPNRFLVEQAQDLPPGRALDVAAGEGRNAIWLAERGWQVTAVDFSAVGTDKGRRLARAAGVEDAVTWVIADVTTWQPPSAGHELVLVAYLHVPVDDRRTAHRSAARAVAPGGTLLVIGHDAANLDGGHGGPQDPSVLFTAEDVVADLDGTGLAIEVATQVRRPVETDEGPRTAIDCLVRASRPG
jgi:SAM-dependent methyltransferase